MKSLAGLILRRLRVFPAEFDEDGTGTFCLIVRQPIDGEYITRVTWTDFDGGNRVKILYRVENTSAVKYVATVQKFVRHFTDL